MYPNVLIERIYKFRLLLIKLHVESPSVSSKYLQQLLIAYEKKKINNFMLAWCCVFRPFIQQTNGKILFTLPC